MLTKILIFYFLVLPDSDPMSNLDHKTWLWCHWSQSNTGTTLHGIKVSRLTLIWSHSPCQGCHFQEGGGPCVHTMWILNYFRILISWNLYFSRCWVSHPSDSALRAGCDCPHCLCRCRGHCSHSRHPDEWWPGWWWCHQIIMMIINDFPSCRWPCTPPPPGERCPRPPCSQWSCRPGWLACQTWTPWWFPRHKHYMRTIRAVALGEKMSLSDAHR